MTKFAFWEFCELRLETEFYEVWALQQSVGNALARDYRHPSPQRGGKLSPSARAASPYSILSRYDLRFHRSLPLPAVHYYRVDERRQPDHDDEDVDDAGQAST